MTDDLIGHSIGFKNVGEGEINKLCTQLRGG